MMEKLPREIAFEIFYRLPLESVVRCKLVCKSWRSLLLPFGDDDGNYFANMLVRRRHRDQQRNLDYSTLNFIALHKEEGSAVVEIYNTEYNDEVEGLHCTIKRLAFSLNYISVCWLMSTISLVGSCNGLLCLTITDDYHRGTTNDEYSLKDIIGICNPVLHEYVTLPLSDLQYFKYASVTTGFGHNPITDEYKVVRVYYRKQHPCYNIGDVEVYTLGGKTTTSSNGGAAGMWRSKGTIKYRLSSGPLTALINGSFHWLADTESEQFIVSFDLEDEEFRVIPLPTNLNRTNMSIEQLIVLRGSLCLIWETRERLPLGLNINLDIWVLKESWVKEFSIKWLVGRSLYSPVAIKKKKDGDGDEILCWRNTKYLVSYDPKTEKFSTVGGRQVGDSGWIYDSILHINSLVSLKALGEYTKYAESRCLDKVL